MSKKQTNNNNQPQITVDPNMRDYSKEPAFIKAKERAVAFLEKHPLPKEFALPKKKDK